MTSICIHTRDNGSLSVCPVVDLDEERKGDVYVKLIAARFNGQFLQLGLSPEQAGEIGEALVKIGKELEGTRGFE